MREPNNITVTMLNNNKHMQIQHRDRLPSHNPYLTNPKTSPKLPTPYIPIHPSVIMPSFHHHYHNAGIPHNVTYSILHLCPSIKTINITYAIFYSQPYPNTTFYLTLISPIFYYCIVNG